MPGLSAGPGPDCQAFFHVVTVNANVVLAVLVCVDCVTLETVPLEVVPVFTLSIGAGMLSTIRV